MLQAKVLTYIAQFTSCVCYVHQSQQSRAENNTSKYVLRSIRGTWPPPWNNINETISCPTPADLAEELTASNTRKFVIDAEDLREENEDERPPVEALLGHCGPTQQLQEKPPVSVQNKHVLHPDKIPGCSRNDMFGTAEENEEPARQLSVQYIIKLLLEHCTMFNDHICFIKACSIASHTFEIHVRALLASQVFIGAC